MDSAKASQDRDRYAMAQVETLAINREDLAVAALLRLSGEVDLETVPQLSDALNAVVGESRSLIVDCSALQYIDSAGLHALFRAQRALDGCGQRMLVASPSPPLRRAFDIIMLARHIHIVASVEEALHLLGQRDGGGDRGRPTA